MIAPKNFFLLPRAPTSKQERLLLQSLAGQHKHQDFFIASCCGIVNTTISTFPRFPSDFVIRLCLLGCLWGTKKVQGCLCSISGPVPTGRRVSGCWLPAMRNPVCLPPTFIRLPNHIISPHHQRKRHILGIKCYPLYHRIFCPV